MSLSFSFEPADRVTVGAVGEPGHRIFYLQAASGGELVTLLAEKEQIQALAETLARLLESLPDVADEGPEIPEADLDLVEPLLTEWRAGSMALDYEEAGDRIVLIVQEFVPEDGNQEPGVLRLSASRAQVRALSIHAAEVVSSGRPRCHVCSGPMDPEGHDCPGMNGHRTIGA